MSNYILDKAYEVEEESGVLPYRVLVYGSGPGLAKLPTQANQAGLLGVTTHSQMRHRGQVCVRKAGIARVMAEGPIRVGSPVMVTAGGKVGDPVDCPYPVECLGFAETPADKAGDLVEVFISIHQRII